MTNIVRRTLFGEPSVDLFSELEWGLKGFPNLQWRPAEDIIQTEDCTVVKMDVPGIKRENLTIEMQDRVLTVEGNRHSESASRYGGYQRFERSSGSFSRSFRIPEGVEADEIKANLEDGVLELQIPRSEQAQTKQIDIGETIEIEAGDVEVEEKKKEKKGKQKP